MIPVARPDIGPEEIAAVTAVLESGMLAGGRKTAELEERWAAFIGTKHAIAVSNGTVALMCIFEGLGLVPGDEVITVGHTFNATVSAILTNDRFPRATAPDGSLAGTDDWQVSPIHLETGCSVGAGAIVVAGNDVGAYALVGAGAVVTRTVPSYALVVGDPARRIGWACVCGHRLADSQGHDAPAVRDRYAIDRELVCPSCDRRYAFALDDEALEERPSPVTQATDS